MCPSSASGGGLSGEIVSPLPEARALQAAASILVHPLPSNETETMADKTQRICIKVQVAAVCPGEIQDMISGR